MSVECCKHNKILGDCDELECIDDMREQAKARIVVTETDAARIVSEAMATYQRPSEDQIRAELRRDDLPASERRMLRSLIYGEPDRKKRPLFMTGGTIFRHGEQTFAPFRSGTPKKPEGMTARQLKKERRKFKAAARVVLLAGAAQAASSR